MRAREKRLIISVLLTAADVIVVNRYGGAIWQCWATNLWPETLVCLLLLTWAGSAAMLWLHVWADFKPARFTGDRTMPCPPREPKEEPDV